MTDYRTHSTREIIRFAFQEARNVTLQTFFFITLQVSDPKKASSIYDFRAKDIDGNLVDLGEKWDCFIYHRAKSKFSNKKMLFSGTRATCALS